MRKKTTRQIFFGVLFSFPFLLCATIDSNTDTSDLQFFKEWDAKGKITRYESPDSAIQLYHQSYNFFLNKRDTLAAVQSLVEKAGVHGHKAEYQSAYDNLWKALLLADFSEDERAKIEVYLHLGRYYSFYKREEKSLEYFQLALSLSQDLMRKDSTARSDMANCYYAFCSTYRELGDPQKGKIYLDSCLMYSHDEAIPYLKFEEAYIKSAYGKHQEALDSMFTIQSWLEKNNPGYQVLLFAYVGDIYFSLNNKQKAENFYQKSLATAKQYNSHLDFVPTVHERLSNLYLSKGNYQKAFTSLREMKELDQQFFDSRSINNRSLLEIKDEFKLEKEKQKQFIQQQRLIALEHQERVAFLKNTLLLVTIIFLVFAGILYFNYVRNRHQAEKQLIKKKRELELLQAEELLELKNKELATSSLKLIEKDEILATLKERLSKGSGDLNANELKKIVRSISHSNAQNWEDFEARFISVNKNFYEKLNSKYPKLSRGDQKLCALVKLNLSSKEMAKLLGISIESVHTNRYRLRKKLGLNREISLTEFVAKL